MRAARYLLVLGGRGAGFGAWVKEQGEKRVLGRLGVRARRKGAGVDKTGGQVLEPRAGTTWCCARCEKPYQHREPSQRRPEQFRLRVGVCSKCKWELLERLHRELAQIAARVAATVAHGNVRLLFPPRPRPERPDRVTH